MLGAQHTHAGDSTGIVAGRSGMEKSPRGLLTQNVCPTKRSRLLVLSQKRVDIAKP